MTKSNEVTIDEVRELYEFLQGRVPNSLTIKHPPKLSKKRAFLIIWYLQEYFRILPDHFEQCSVCGELYDSYSEGHHSDLTGKFYCNEDCEPPNLRHREARLYNSQTTTNE